MQRTTDEQKIANFHFLVPQFSSEGFNGFKGVGEIITVAETLGASSIFARKLENRKGAGRVCIVPLHDFSNKRTTRYRR